MNKQAMAGGAAPLISAGSMREAPDTRALNAFLASVEKRALRIAEIATQDRDEALDIVQDAMLRLARSYSARPAAEWPALFHRILENAIQDWRRRRKVRQRWFAWGSSSSDPDDPSDPIERLPDSAPIPDADGLMRDEAMQRLQTGLEKLPRRQREAFVLRVWEGLSVEQTANAMGCSDGSVKTHLSRALASLRVQLEGVWP